MLRSDMRRNSSYSDDEFEADDPKSEGWARIERKEIEVGKEIGGGGVALVFEGYFRNRKVAIKTLFDPKVDDHLQKEYLDELLVMASLKHANVVEFIGGCVDPPDLFFVMERCEGSLHRVVHGSKAEGVLPEKLCLKDKLGACTDVAEGMAYLHSKDIIHRDLKTANVLRVGARYKLCDFGLVRTPHAGAGTPSYMAPELLLGHAFNRKVDVYAFGILLGEVFAEQVPFLGYDYPDLKRKVPRGERPALPRFDCPEAVLKVVEACWRTDESKRPAFEDVVYDLGKVDIPTDHCGVLDSLEFGGGDCLDMLMTHK
jgi:serine/threonine protein kinase